MFKEASPALEVAVENLQTAKGEDRDEAKLDRALFELGRSKLMLHLGENWPFTLLLVQSSPSLEIRRFFLKPFKDHENVLMGSSDTGLKRSIRIGRQLYGKKSVEVAEVHRLLALVHIRHIFCFHFVKELSLESTNCKRSKKLAEKRLIAALRILCTAAKNSPEHPTWRFTKALILQELFVLEFIWENYDKARARCRLARATLKPVAAIEIGEQLKKKFDYFLCSLDYIEGKIPAIDMVD